MTQTLDEVVDQSVALHVKAGLGYPAQFQQKRKLHGTKRYCVQLVTSGKPPQRNPSKMIAAGLEEHTVEAIVINHPDFDDEPEARKAARWRLEQLREANKKPE